MKLHYCEEMVPGKDNEEHLLFCAEDTKGVLWINGEKMFPHVVRYCPLCGVQPSQSQVLQSFGPSVLRSGGETARL